MFTQLCLFVAVAAVAHFFTNWLAILMLFHPREKRWWWPWIGAIPKERARMARAIGTIVERDLIVPETFARRIREGSLGAELTAFMSRELRRLVALESERSLADLVGEPFVERLVAIVRERVAEYLDSPALRERVTGETGAYLESVFASRPADLMSTKLADGIRDLLVAELETVRLGDAVIPFLSRQVDLAIYNLLNSQRRLSDFPWIVEKINDNEEVAVDRTLRFLLERLRSNRVRDALYEMAADRVVTLYRRYMNDKWYRKLFDAVSSTEEELVGKIHAEMRTLEAWLVSDEGRDETKRWILGLFDREAKPLLLDSTLAELAAHFRVGDLEQVRDSILGGVVGMIRQEGVGRYLGETVTARVTQLLGQTVESIVAKAAPRERLLEELRAGLSTRILAILAERRDEILAIFDANARDAARSFRIGHLLERVREEEFVALTGAVFARALDLLGDNMARLVSALRLSEIVSEEVGKFDLERIEKLIYDISGRELRIITWLGAVFGAGIGLAQFVFQYLIIGK